MKKQVLYFALIMVFTLSILSACAPANPVPDSSNDATAIDPRDPSIASFFPDANFEMAVREILNKPTGDITQEDVAGITTLEISNMHITNLSGIEYFTALTKLSCNNNELAALDVSKNTELIFLECWGNRLTVLNVSGCAKLTEIYCHMNQLTALDISKNPVLIDIHCGYNQLTTLNTSKNTALVALFCESNQLTTLDVSKNVALEWINCESNKLTKLDVSNCTALRHLSCYGNNFSNKSDIIGLDESRTVVDFSEPFHVAP